MILPVLTDFLGAHFHQDWNCDYADTTEAVDYAGGVSTTTLRATLTELEQLLVSDLNDEHLDDWLTRAGCEYYLPSGQYRPWLREIDEVMRRELESRAGA